MGPAHPVGLWQSQRLRWLELEGRNERPVACACEGQSALHGDRIPGLAQERAGGGFGSELRVPSAWMDPAGWAMLCAAGQAAHRRGMWAQIVKQRSFLSAEERKATFLRWLAANF